MVLNFRKNTTRHSDPERSEGEESTNFMAKRLEFMDSSPFYERLRMTNSTLF